MKSINLKRRLMRASLSYIMRFQYQMTNRVKSGIITADYHITARLESSWSFAHQRMGIMRDSADKMRS